jgi:hypothetical protein
MQETSDLYKDLYRNDHRTETRLLIGSKDAPISDIQTAYYEDSLRSLSTSMRMFSEDTPAVGGCMSGEIKVVMNYPQTQPPRQAKLVPQIRLTDGVRNSEWISKGVFFIDTRRKTGEGTKVESLTLTGFDAMLRTEQDYPTSKLTWPATDIDVVREIAAFIGVEIDQRTIGTMDRGYRVQYPGGEYSCRDTLGYIAAMYGACFIMNDVGQLHLVKLNSFPKETNYLIDSNGFAITFGGVRILV